MTIEPLARGSGAKAFGARVSGVDLTHPLVRRHSFTDEPALFIGSHLREIEGLPPREGRALGDALLAHATRPELVHTHEWRPFDLVAWDNSAVIHRGRPWDENEPQHLVRATVADDGFTAGELAA